MSDSLINLIKQQKMNVFNTLDSPDIAMKYALDLLGDSPRSDVTIAIMCYHNTLLDSVIHVIKNEDRANGPRSIVIDSTH